MTRHTMTRQTITCKTVTAAAIALIALATPAQGRETPVEIAIAPAELQRMDLLEKRIERIAIAACHTSAMTAPGARIACRKDLKRKFLATLQALREERSGRWARADAPAARTR